MAENILRFLMFVVLHLRVLGPPTFDDHYDKMLDALRSAELVIVGEVVEIGPVPHIDRGYFAPTQWVQYRVVEYLKGSADSSLIDVMHQVWGGPGPDAEAGLSPEIFFIRQKLIVAASKTPQGWKTLLALDSQPSVLTASPINVKAVKSILAAGD